jgi:hypothetical protein
MKKQILSFLILLLFTSCVNEYNRLNYLKKSFPNSKVEPATGLVKNGGYEYVLIDSLGNMVAVSFVPFSEKRINGLRNVR